MEKVAHLIPFGLTKKIRINKTFLILLIILLTAAFLRLYRIGDYMVFLGDEGRDMLVIYNILHGKLTLLGPTASVGGFFLGPVYYYFITPFLWLFNYDPVGPSVMVGLLGVATVFLVYQVGKEFFSKKAGLIAAVLYATSPVVVSLSRSSWNPNVMPFFSLLTLYTLYKAVSKNSIKLFFLSGVFIGITLQLHYLATFLGAIMFFYVLVNSSPLKDFIGLIKKYSVMFVGFLFGLSPFLVFELRHDFTNTRNVINFIFHSGDTGAGSQVSSNLSFVFDRLFGGLITNFPLPRDFFIYTDQTVKTWNLLFLVLAILSIVYLIVRFLNNRKKDEVLKWSLIIVWGFLGILLFAFYKKPIYDYYLGFLFPLPFLVVGYFLSNFLKKTIVGFATILFICLLLFLNLNFSHLRNEPNRLIHQTSTISDFVLEKTEGKPYNFALLSKANQDSAYRYFFKIRGRDPVVIIPPQLDPERNSVTEQLFVVCEENPCKPEGHPLWEVAGFGQAEISEEWDVSVVKVYKLIHAD